MHQHASNTKVGQNLQCFRSILDPVPFEAVITWVYQAPEPQASTWWRRWWGRV